MRSRFFAHALLAVALVVLPCPLGICGQGARPVCAAEAVSGSDGLLVGVDFDVPLVIASKATTGKALVTADKTLRVYYVLDGKVAVLTYTLTRGGDAAPPDPVDPDKNKVKPKPSPQKITKLFLIWDPSDEAKTTPAVANMIRRSDDWRNACVKLGIRPLAVAQKEGLTVYPEATRLASAKGLPALVFAGDAAAVAVEALPKTEADLVKLIETKGGAK